MLCVIETYAHFKLHLCDDYSCRVCDDVLARATWWCSRARRSIANSNEEVATNQQIASHSSERVDWSSHWDRDRWEEEKEWEEDDDELALVQSHISY